MTMEVAPDLRTGNGSRLETDAVLDIGVCLDTGTGLDTGPAPELSTEEAEEENIEDQ